MATKKAAPPARKAPKSAKQGNLKSQSRQLLAIKAREAYTHLQSAGVIEDGVSFDAWRKEQVMAAVGLPGISALNGLHFRTVMAHFLALAGQDDKAFRAYTTTGRVKDSGPSTDTHEAREQWFAMLRNEVAAHVALATTPEAEVLDGDRETWTTIQAAGGAIGEGYVVVVAQNKFGVARVQMERLLERLTATQLEQLFYTIRNRIASREGRPESNQGRNRGQRGPAAKARRKAEEDPGELAPRSPDPDGFSSL
jgi:hypothetical protein